MARPVMEEQDRRSTHIQFRMEPAILDRLKSAADRKGLTVNALARLWLYEKLEQEPVRRKRKA